LFVGARRIEAVDALERSFECVVAGAGSRLVVLSAPTGFGKSRIVQEFYARIAASQSVPAYWPARIEGNQTLRWTDSRKCVFPSGFVVPAGAQLPWFWWGVSCGKRQDGRHAQALFDDATQLAAHGGSLYDRLRGADVAGRSFDGTSALIGALGLLGVALVPPVAIGATIAGGVRTLWQNKDLLDRLRNWRARRDMRTNGATVDAESHGRGAQISELAANLVTVSRKVPVVLAVDDAHWADPTLVEFVDKVLQNPRARVLIVATTWPILGANEKTGPFSKWLRDALVAEPKKRCIEVKTLEGLGEQDLAELVQAEYAVVAPDDAHPLSEAVIAGVLDLVGVTPMGVRALFGLERTRRLIAEGGLTLHEMGRLPRDLEDALRLYWDDIPEEVQTVLAIAAVAGFRFLPTPVVAAATAQEIDDALGRLKEGENPYSFVRNVETGLATFADPIFHDTAQREADDTFTNAQQDSIHQAIIDYALTVSLADQGPAVCEAAWSAHVRFASEGFSDPTLAASSAVNLAQLSASRFDYLAAIDLARRSLKWTALPLGDSQMLTLRYNLARWLSLAGQLHEAEQMARRLLEVLLEMPASNDRDARLVNAHLELAMSLKQQQKLDAALEESRKAEDLLSELEISDQSRISLRRLVQRTQAGCLGERPETVGQAIDVLEALLADEARPALPYDEAMQIRQGLGSLYADQRMSSAERLAQAVEVFNELRKDRERVLGVDDPATLETTHSLAWALAVSGPEFQSESLELFTRVARDRDRVLGPENPETLRTRHCVAWVNAERDDIEAALRQYESLLSDSQRFLGHDHPDTKNAEVSLEQLRARTREMAATTFLLADALKPKEGETFAELRLRAEEATSTVSHGAEALAALGERDPARAHRYRTLTWRRRQLPLRDLRVWPGMGGLPDSWCDGSVVDTANHLRREGVPESAARLKDLLPLLSNIDRDELSDWLSYLPLLVVPDVVMHDRPPHPTAPWRLDDGCHRAIMLCLLGIESVAVLVGEPT
jgi:tetratricopeptide (TPR) repeat protein